MKRPLDLKVDLLANGVQLTDSLLRAYGPPYLPKRRAYGNQDPIELRNKLIPQEVLLGEGEAQLIAAVNVKPDSPLTLDHDGDSFYLIDGANDRHLVDFTRKPDLYDLTLASRKKVSQVLTLYGGRSLGIFAYGACELVKIGKPCAYCSIAQNRDKGTDFEQVIGEKVVTEALRLALKSAPPEVNQVMLNGGNFPDEDKSFLHYVNLLKRIVGVIQETRADIEAHMIVYPPNDLDLIEELSGLPVSIAMNSEVFDPELFERFCPGKDRQKIQDALFKGVEVLGEGRVFSIVVGGLEPIDSLRTGMQFLAENGVTPVINVLHTDPGTPLEHFPKPTYGQIMEMGTALQGIYGAFNLKPFYLDCGRNSLDTEAYKQLFY